jgi:hypothetical protein
MSLECCIVDIGNNICGQTYVALSRVTTLNGLHLINFDPANIKAQTSAIDEYNRLKKKYRPDLKLIDKNFQKHYKIRDLSWVKPSTHIIKSVQQNDFVNQLSTQLLQQPGFINDDGVSCYANVSLQVILNCQYIVNQLMQFERHFVLSKLAASYFSQHKPLDCTPLRQVLGQPFNFPQQQDAAEFINALLCQSNSLKNSLKHELISVITCLNCNEVRTNKSPNYILPLSVIDSKSTLNSLFNDFSKEIVLEIKCSNCNITGNHSKVMHVSSPSQYVFIQIQLWNELLKKMQNIALVSLPTTTLQINNNAYNLCSAICHHGESLHSSHYTSIIKKSNIWFRCNDLISNKERWPRGGKDVYIIILEKQN